jgi:hypothetical protein
VGHLVGAVRELEGRVRLLEEKLARFIQ